MRPGAAKSADHVREPIPAPRRDLRVRTLSALVLIAVGFVVVIAGGVIYASWLGFLGVVLALEWATLIGRARRDAATFAHAAAAAAAPFAILFLGPGPAAGGLLLAVAAVAGLGADRRLWSAFGVIYVLGPQIALITLREAAGAGTAGLVATIGLFVVVGLTDTASLMIGRGLGGPRLPRWISEGKTWSGLVGGAAAGVLGGVLYAHVWLPGTALGAATVMAVSLACATQAGDIAESILKRHFGVKDVGRLIPGHGGAMDRFDGALFAAPVAAFWARFL